MPDFVANSDRFFWKSVDTTQSFPSDVNKAKNFPLGETAIFVNGPCKR